jgi:hypothetical protein
MRNSTQLATATHANKTEPAKQSPDRNDLLHLLQRLLPGVSVSSIDQFSGKTITEILNELYRSPETEKDLFTGSFSSHFESPGDSSGRKERNYLQKDSMFRLLMQMLSDKHSLKPKMTLFWLSLFGFKRPITDSFESQAYFKSLYLHSLSDLPTVFINELVHIPITKQQLRNHTRAKQTIRAFSEFVLTHHLYGSDCYKFLSKTKVNRFVNLVYDSFFTEKSFVSPSGPIFSQFADANLSSSFPHLRAGIETLLRNETIATNLATRIFRFFVSKKIDFDSYISIINPLTACILEPSYQIKDILLRLFSNENFFDQKYRNVIVKDDFSFLGGLIRKLEILFGDLPSFPYSDVYTESVMHVRAHIKNEKGNIYISFPEMKPEQFLQPELSTDIIAERMKICSILVDVYFIRKKTHLQSFLYRLITGIDGNPDLTNFLLEFHRQIFLTELSIHNRSLIQKHLFEKLQLTDNKWKYLMHCITHKIDEERAGSYLLTIVKETILNIFSAQEYQFE